jgi:4-aminobutyrate aminotransferase-like enzyme
VTTAAAPVGPSVTVPYPGPAARSLIERMRAVEGAGPRTMGTEDPLVVAEGRNASLLDPDGNVFVDLAGSFAAATLGHAHPEVTASIREQAGRVGHVSSAAISEPRIAFEEALVDIAPPGLDRVLLGISGADANDTALRLARSLTGRSDVLAFSGGYFGRAGGVVGLNGKHVHRARTARDAEAHFLPYPDPTHWPLGGVPATQDVGAQALALAEHALEDPASGVGPVAAIVVEPVQGNGGIVVPPDGFLEGLRQLCDRTGALLVFDEIQVGFGRTGRLWAGEHWGVVPDLMTVGKGIGGGLALSAVLARQAHMAHWPAGTHTSTFLGNAVNLAAGRAAIDVMRRDRLWERSARLGATTIASLHADLAGAPQTGEVRGLGLCIGIPIVRSDGSGQPDPARAAAIKRAAFERGVIVALAGHAEHVLKITPPLTIEDDVLATSVRILIDAIQGDA